MKTFIFKVENTTKNPSRYGGRKQKAVIYQFKKGKLEYLGETHWHTAYYRGAISCVNEWLLENKIIPKIWSKGEQDSFYETHKCRGGYYTPYYMYRTDKSKYQILSI